MTPIRDLTVGSLRYVLTAEACGEQPFTLATLRDGRVVGRMGFGSICGADLMLEGLGADTTPVDPVYEAVAAASSLARAHGRLDAYAVLVRLLEAWGDEEWLGDLGMAAATSERPARQAVAS